MRNLKIKFISALALSCFAGLQFTGGRCEADNPPLNATSVDTVIDGGVRSISLPHFEPVMPTGPGRAAFMAVCTSCHSPRYVPMQPPFSRIQWEGIVVKMVKVFGANADTNQIHEIAGYLSAINGITLKEHPQSSLPSSDAAVLSISNFESHVEATPLFLPAPGSEEHTADVQRGAAVFVRDCAGCHGATGQGDGFVGHVLMPKPANLTAAQFSVELLSQVLWNGVPGTSMPSWRDLPKKDLEGLVAYVQTLHPTVSPKNISGESLVRGQTLFLQACAPCHGVHGDGKSAAAATLAPAPINLQLEQPDFDYVLQVLREGVPGTAMPVWKSQLSESDRAAVAKYVRSLYKPSQSNNK